MSKTKSAQSRTRAVRPARLACLAASIAYAINGASAAQIQHLPQPDVQIDSLPQPGVRIGTQPLSTGPTAAGKSAPVQRQPPRTSRRPAAQTARSHPSSSAPMVSPHLFLRLSYALTWPAKATSAPTPAPTPATPASAPQPAWLRDLLQILQADEKGTPQPDLPQQIADHAAQLRGLADASLCVRLGWALYRAQRLDEAATWFERALDKDTTQSSAREGAFYALQRAGHWQRAFEMAAGDVKLRPNRADLAVQLALRMRQDRDPQGAVRWLQRAIALGKDDADIRSLLAWSQLQAGDAAAAAQTFAALVAERPRDADLAQGLYLSLQRSGQTARIAELAQQPGAFADWVRKQTALEWLGLGLAEDAAVLDPTASPALAGVAEPSLTLGARLRNKSGATGTSQLRAQELPSLQLRWANPSGVWQAQIDRIRLDAGALAPGAQIGMALPGASGSAATQSAGIGVALRWRALGLHGGYASVGLTPSGGAVSPTWFGSLGWRDLASDHEWQMGFEREPVDDTVLSLVGLRDPVTGRAWGRVLREGLSASGYQRLAPGWNGSVRIKIQRLTGDNVATNDLVAANLGLMRDLNLPGMRYFSLGPGLGYTRYRRNLSGFTWGQGGYFSPQNFTTLGALAVFQTADARPWVLAGQIQVGWQSLQQDASPCFALAPPVTAGQCTGSNPSRSSGIGTSTALQGSVLLSPHWALQGGVRLRTGPAYQDRAAYIGLRYFFTGRTELFNSDLPPQ
jgi:tetratricopeptide (TPR) repeat protein